MTEFVIHLHGGQGTLTVDGEEPALFGEIVGCEVRRDMPLQKYLPQQLAMEVTAPSPRPTVEVTLRLPLGTHDNVTLVRDASILSVHGPTGDSEITTAVPVSALDAHIRDFARLRPVVHSNLSPLAVDSVNAWIEAARTALLAVLDVHKPEDVGSQAKPDIRCACGEYDDTYVWHPYPDRTLLAIAEKLGIEVAA